MNSQYNYLAFISYKREDEKWAKWLQHKLEHYKLPSSVRNSNPALPERLRPVFKDTSDLAGGLLEKSIKEALNSSKYLILICSPRAAKSPWVCKEVQEFIDSGREEFIIPFIVDGEPNSTNLETECFPQNLRDLSGEREILGININEMGRDAAAIKVIARILGIRFDTLWQRWERERKLRNLIVIISILALLFISFGIILYLNKQNRIIHESEALILEQNNSLKSQKAELIQTLNDLERSESKLKETNIALSQTNKSLEHEKNNVLNKNRAMLENRNRYLSELCIDLSNKGNLLLAELLLAEITPHKLNAQDKPFVPEMEYALRHLHRIKDLNDGFYILSNFESPTGTATGKIIIDSTIFYAATDRGIYKYNFSGDRISTIFELPQLDSIETYILDYDLKNHLVLYEYETLNSESPCLVLFNYKTKSSVQNTISDTNHSYFINDHQEIQINELYPEITSDFEEFGNYCSYINVTENTKAILGNKTNANYKDSINLRYPIIDLCLSKDLLGVINNKSTNDYGPDTLLLSLFRYTDDIKLTPIIEDHPLPFNEHFDIREYEIKLIGEINNYNYRNSQFSYSYYLFRNDNNLYFYNLYDKTYFKFNIASNASILLTGMATSKNTLLLYDDSSAWIIKKKDKRIDHSSIAYTDDYYIDFSIYEKKVRYSIYNAHTDSEVAVLPENYSVVNYIISGRPCVYNRGNLIFFASIDSTTVCNLDKLSMQTYETRFNSFMEASNDGKYLYLKASRNWTEGKFSVIDSTNNNYIFTTSDVEYVNFDGLVHHDAYSDIIAYSLFDIYLLDKHNFSIKNRIRRPDENDVIKAIHYFTSEKAIIETDKAIYTFNLKDNRFEFLFSKPHYQDGMTSLSIHPNAMYLMYSVAPRFAYNNCHSATWIWNLESKSLVEFFESDILCPRFSKDGNHIIVSQSDSRDYLLDFPSIEDLCHNISCNNYGCSLSTEQKYKHYLSQ